MQYEIVRHTPTEVRRLDGSPLFDSEKEALDWFEKNIGFVSTGLEAILIRPVDEHEHTNRT